MKSKATLFLTVLLLLVGGALYRYSTHRPINSLNSKVTVPATQMPVISFRVQVLNTGLQTNWLNKGKQPTDFVETRLPGQLYNPPLKFDPIEKQFADRSTPIEAAISDFSSFRAKDKDWIINNFTNEEQDEIRSLVKDLKIGEGIGGDGHLYVTGVVEYGKFSIVLVKHNVQHEHATPDAFEKTDTGWKRTNKLSKDETFDIVFAALFSGEVKVIE